MLLARFRLGCGAPAYKFWLGSSYSSALSTRQTFRSVPRQYPPRRGNGAAGFEVGPGECIHVTAEMICRNRAVGREVSEKPRERAGRKILPARQFGDDTAETARGPVVRYQI